MAATALRPKGRPTVKDEVLYVRTDAETAAYVHHLAAMSGKSVSWVVTQVLKGWRNAS